MKTRFTLLALMLIAFGFTQGQAWQVPNGNLETWGAYSPQGWASYESVNSTSLIGLTVLDTNTLDGSKAIRIRTDSIAVAPSYGVVKGFLSLGTANNQGQLFGIPFTFRPDTLFIDYEYTTPSPDTGVMTLLLNKYLSPSDPYVLGINGYFTTDAWNSTGFVLTPLYSTTNTGNPDSLTLQFVSSRKAAGTQRAELSVDNISFGYVSTPVLIEELKNNVTTNVFPNPAKGQVNITVSELGAYASVMVFDMTGRVVKHQFMDGNQHTLNVSDWAEGIYSYSIIEEGKVTTKGRFTVAK